MGTLYVVATPIGNLEDLSPRAVRILGEVSLIAAEDTRHTGKLLQHFAIRTRLMSYFEHNKLQRIRPVLDALAVGDVALVSDAGTPALNDPGYELVRAALAAGHSVIPVPGPSAAIAALAVSGLPTASWLYLGYLPRKRTERQRFLQSVRAEPHTLVFLESPHRIAAALKDLSAVLGDRPIAVAREMTKLFEEYWRGTITGALQYFSSQAPRGEFVIVVSGAAQPPRGARKPSTGRWTDRRLTGAIRRGLAAGETPSRLAARLAGESGWERREVYKRITS